MLMPGLVVQVLSYLANCSSLRILSMPVFATSHATLPGSLQQQLMQVLMQHALPAAAAAAAQISHACKKPDVVSAAVHSILHDPQVRQLLQLLQWTQFKFQDLFKMLQQVSNMSYCCTSLLALSVPDVLLIRMF